VTTDLHDELIRIPLDGAESVTARVTCREDAPPGRLLVLFPPHPSLGGDAENNVIRALARAGVEAGRLVLRLHYRRTESEAADAGRSLAFWDDLDARQDYEIIATDSLRIIETVLKAFARIPTGGRRAWPEPAEGAVAAVFPATGADGAAPSNAVHHHAAVGQRGHDGNPSIEIAAYSFGVYVALRVLGRLGPARLVGISPPLMEHDFSAVLPAAGITGRVAFIGTAGDPFCPPDALQNLAEAAGGRWHLFEAGDHFYRGEEARLASAVLTMFEND